MSRIVEIDGQVVALAEPTEVPSIGGFFGRGQELELCRAAWGIEASGKRFTDANEPSLHFRLEGPPGVGKNEIVYQLARQLKQPLYVMQGHEELTPEDLALVLVPDSTGSTFRDAPLMLRASPLATALYEGGLCFFDEINRVPERALSPLSSVLDDRRSLYSALAGIQIKPKQGVEGRFRFCCALNPALSEAGHGVLPDYIDERTLPAIRVDYLEFEVIQQILVGKTQPDEAFIQALERWYERDNRKRISARQALIFMRYAMSLAAQNGQDPDQALARAEEMIFRDASAGTAEAKKGGSDADDDFSASLESDLDDDYDLDKDVDDDGDGNSDDLPQQNGSRW